MSYVRIGLTYILRRKIKPAENVFQNFKKFAHIFPKET
jgi:hypothetical protein